MSYNVLAAAINHPDPVNSYFGLFNARSIAALTDRGVNVDVVTPRPFALPIGPYSEYSEIPSVSQHDGYEAHHPRFFYGLPKRWLYGLTGRSYAKRVPAYVEDTFDVPDVVHAYHIYPDGYGMLPYCREHDLPLFVVAHGTTLNKFEEFPSGVQSKILETLVASDTVLCVSNSLADRAERLEPNIETQVVPLGADPSEFPTESEDRLRDKMGIPPNRPIVFFCGSYVEEKGVGDIIEILPDLTDVDAHFLFVGRDGPLRKRLEDRVAEIQMEEKVDVMYDEPVNQYFAVADLFLLPSYSEGRPTVIYEAMASETAVLATEVGGIPEQVVDGVTGVLLEAGELKDLKNELISLTSNQEIFRRMGQNGYQRLLNQGWTWEDHARTVSEIHFTGESHS